MPLNLTFIEEPGKFNFFNLGAFLGSGETQEERKQQNIKAISLLQHYGVLPTKESIIKCEFCNVQMGIENDKSKNFLGFRFKCKNINCLKFNRNKKSPLNGTMFADGNMPLEDKGTDYFGVADYLKMMVMWFFRLPVTKSQYHGQIGSSATTCHHFREFRKVCRTVESHDTGKIGGADDVIEVDESHLYRRKYNRGRTLYSERHLWVFGGISRKTGKRFAVRVDKRDGDTLHSQMSAHISQGSFILSDGWRAYASSPIVCGFKGHAWVNHSQGEFVRPYPAVIEDIHRSLGTRVLVEPPSTSPSDPSLREVLVHTNTVERMWRDLKENMRGVRGDTELIEDAIGEWLYRKNILDYENHHPGKQFVRFLRDITRVHPGLGRQGIKDPYGNEECQCQSCLEIAQVQDN